VPSGNQPHPAEARHRPARAAGEHWSNDEIDEPLLADHRNFYKVEQWTKDEQLVERMLWAGNSLDRARAIFNAEAKRRPRCHYTIRQRSRVLAKWPQLVSEKPTYAGAMIRRGQLIEIGEALYGPSWGSALAKALHVEDRTYRA
jgi:hypothetical protein